MAARHTVCRCTPCRARQGSDRKRARGTFLGETFRVLRKSKAWVLWSTCLQDLDTTTTVVLLILVLVLPIERPCLGDTAIQMNYCIAQSSLQRSQREDPDHPHPC